MIKIEELFELANKTFEEVGTALMGWDGLLEIMNDSGDAGVADEITMSNATDWLIESVDVLQMSITKDSLVFNTVVWMYGRQDPDRSFWTTQIAADTVIQFRSDRTQDISIRQAWTDTCEECWCHGVPFEQYVSEQLKREEESV